MSDSLCFLKKISRISLKFSPPYLHFFLNHFIQKGYTGHVRQVARDWNFTIEELEKVFFKIKKIIN